MPLSTGACKGEIASDCIGGQQTSAPPIIRLWVFLRDKVSFTGINPYGILRHLPAKGLRLRKIDLVRMTPFTIGI